MKQFFKYVFATIVGLILFGFVLFFFFGVLLVGSVKKSFEKEKASISANSILMLNFDNTINDRPTDDPINPFLPNFDMNGNMGLRPIAQAIEEAKSDDDIKGIYISPAFFSTGYANLHVLMEAIDDFKESGKFVVANSNFYTQKAYGLASVADEIYLQPEGSLDFKGINASIMFYKGAMDKLGIEDNVFYAGKFKSATEPFRRKNMSQENKIQTKEFIEDIYSNFIEDIAENRGMTAEELRTIADDYLARSPEDAVEHKLIDGVKYHDEVMDILREKVNFEDDEELNFVKVNDYVESKGLDDQGSKYGSGNKIAIVYAEGGIGMGGDENEGISGERYRKLLEEIRNDDKIKAVVLRVNSPGGSVLDSDIIYREVELLKQEKTVVTSMGNVAASGGYYIACNSEKIFAEENTITGSIGVFISLFNSEKFLNNKLGLTIDGVQTGKFSDFPSLTRDWNGEENAIMQEFVDDIYADFLQKVADGRGMNVEQVHEVAQGRVWSGEDALELGLVDEIGGLEAAVAYAKEQAEINDFKVVTYPKYKDAFQQLMESFDLEAKAENQLKTELGPYYKYIDLFKQVNAMEGPQMRMPFELEMN
ncbi:MAG: signal peptide peptidase SppA [Saprospiraceae bacterium]|nr:signal peptide peptidase SppA [Saprospiraceae bacterium]